MFTKLYGVIRQMAKIPGAIWGFGVYQSAELDLPFHKIRPSVQRLAALFESRVFCDIEENVANE
jgi:hypothetical protein